MMGVSGSLKEKAPADARALIKDRLIVLEIRHYEIPKCIFDGCQPIYWCKLGKSGESD